MKPKIAIAKYLFCFYFPASFFVFFGTSYVEARSEKLSRSDLKYLFGDKDSFPEYSLFTPNLSPLTTAKQRRKRSTTNSSLFEFTALGNDYQFILEPVRNLISKDFVLIGRSYNQSEILNFKDLSHCTFQGRDKEDVRKSIALVMCENLRGVVKLPDGELVIEPLPEAVMNERRTRRDTRNYRRSFGNLNNHIVYRRKGLKTCYLQEEQSEAPKREYLFSRYANPVFKFDSSRNDNRGNFYHNLPSTFKEPEEDIFETGTPETFYIETAVFVDRDLLRLMEINFPRDTEEQVIEVVLAMVNAVQLLYNDPSLGHKIKYVLKRLELLYQDPPGLSRPHDIDLFLTKFCMWQNTENPPSDDENLHWDHALILTGLDLYTIMDDRKLNSQVVGLAPVAGMCTRTSSCTVNEGRHFESVYVVAHEIGHNLGMRHDGLQSGNNCDPSGYLMSPTLGSGKVTWSHCSKRYLNNFLRLSQSKCLRDKPLAPPDGINHEGLLLPGQRFSAEQQCMLKNGVGSRASLQQPQNEVCGDLHCVKDGYTWTSHPALEGTSCGPSKWCRRGDCVDMPRDQHPEVSNSLKSLSSSFSMDREDLGSWSTCKSSCLYGLDGILSSGSTGLSVSENRACSTCRSEYRYRVCSAVRECSVKEKRTLQDFADEICRRVMRENPILSGYAVRVPYGGIKRCEVLCLKNNGSPYLTRASYPDGAVCHSATNHPSYCVGGFCTEFRCDPDALFKAGDAVCRFNSPQSSGRLTPQEVQAAERLPSPNAPFQIVTHTTPLNLGNNWGPWIASSACRFSCISPSKGIQLVTRSCSDLRGCDGLNRNIQICSPTRMDCNEVQTPFKYASDICQRYSKSVKQLSGIGMQLSSTPDDPNRSCTVACQDATLKYRFYKVNGKDGWFPFGTECSSNGIDAYCMNGKCLEFNSDGTPLRNTIDTDLRTKGSRSLAFFIDDFEDSPQVLSSLRHIGDDVVESHWRIKRDLRTSSHRLPGTLRDSYLLSLVDEINATFSVQPSYDHEAKSSFIDLDNPLFNDGYIDSTVGPDLAEKESRVVEENQNGSLSLLNINKYRWFTTSTPCSVTCGEGIMKFTIKCVDESDNEVEKRLCPRPVPPTQLKCFRKPCQNNYKKIPSSILESWLKGIVDEVRKKHP